MVSKQHLETLIYLFKEDTFVHFCVSTYVYAVGFT